MTNQKAKPSQFCLQVTLLDGISTLKGLVEFEESGFLLEALRSSVLHAIDPINCRDKATGNQSQALEYQRVQVALHAFSVMLSSGAIPQRGADNALITQFVNSI